MDGLCGVTIRANDSEGELSKVVVNEELPVIEVPESLLEQENDKAICQQLEKLQARKEMVTPRSWEAFRDTGLLMIVNQILHIFGWAIVFEMADPASGHITNVYPARVKFRGFDSKNIGRAYQKVGKWLAENSQELYDEANYEEDEF